MMSVAMGSLNAQGVGELLGAADWSDHAIVVVVTDLQNVYHLYWIDSKQKDAHTRMAQSKNVPPIDAWLFIRRWLMELSSPDTIYTIERDRRRGAAAITAHGFG